MARQHTCTVEPKKAELPDCRYASWGRSSIAGHASVLPRRIVVVFPLSGWRGDQGHSRVSRGPSSVQSSSAQ